MNLPPHILEAQVQRELAVLRPRRDVAERNITALEAALAKVEGFRPPSMLEAFQPLADGVMALLEVSLEQARMGYREADTAVKGYEQALSQAQSRLVGTRI